MVSESEQCLFTDLICGAIADCRLIAGSIEIMKAQRLPYIVHGPVGLVLLVLIGAFSTFKVQADCISLIRGPIAFDVKSCGVLNPELTFDLRHSRFHFIKNLPPKDRKKFLNSYRGMLIRGRVAGSDAVRSGLTNEKGALNGDEISVFVPPKSSQFHCPQLMSKRIKAYLDEACCEGGGDPPCLLSSSYVIKNIGVLGSADKLAIAKKNRGSLSKLQLQGEGFLRKKNYRKAAALLEQARSSKQLDLGGHFRLGYAYRQLDKCQKAIEPLEYVAQKADKNEFWAEEEGIIRHSQFLLARCYAKLNKPDYAVAILETFLLDPKKNQKELKSSLKHKDFGWIHTTKEYLNYRSEVYRRLNIK